MAVPVAVIDGGAVGARGGVEPRLSAKEASGEVVEADAALVEIEHSADARKRRHVGERQVVVLQLQ